MFGKVLLFLIIQIAKSELLFFQLNKKLLCIFVTFN